MSRHVRWRRHSVSGAKTLSILGLIMAVWACGQPGPAPDEADIAPPAIANGSVTVADQSFTIKYAYAMRQKGIVDHDGEEIGLLLTDQSIPDGGLDDLDRVDLAVKAHGLNHYVFFLLDGQGRPLIERISNPLSPTPHQRGLQSVSPITLSTLDPDRIAGGVRTNANDRLWGDIPYSLNATFDVPIVRSKSLEKDDAGQPHAMAKSELQSGEIVQLPGGGEPGVTWRIYDQALKNRDPIGIRDVFLSARLPMDDNQLLDSLDPLLARRPRDAEIVNGVQRDKRAMLKLSGSINGETVAGMVQLIRIDEKWIIHQESWVDPETGKPGASFR